MDEVETGASVDCAHSKVVGKGCGGTVGGDLEEGRPGPGAWIDDTSILPLVPEQQ